MKKMILLALGAAAIVVMTGCASIQTASKNDLNGQKLTLGKTTADIAHVNGDNWGLYLLWIPLLTGSTDNVGDMCWNEDTVNVPHVVNMVTKKGKELGAAEVVDLNSSVTSSFFPPVFFVKEVQVSGNGVK